MASILEPCGQCGKAVRFPAGQQLPEIVICESYICKAQAAHTEKLNATRQVVEADKPGKGPKPDKDKPKDTKEPKAAGFVSESVDTKSDTNATVSKATTANSDKDLANELSDAGVPIQSPKGKAK